MVREGWRDRETGKGGAPRVQFLYFEMLQNTLENHAKKLTLKLNINNLKKDEVKVLSNKMKSFKGDKSLFFNVYDSKKQVKLILQSRKKKIKIDAELLKIMDGEGWPYQIN